MCSVHAVHSCEQVLCACVRMYVVCVLVYKSACMHAYRHAIFVYDVCIMCSMYGICVCVDDVFGVCAFICI